MEHIPADRTAIIFDFGGVLFDWNPHYLYLKFFNGNGQAVDDFLSEIHFSEWNLRQDQGRPFSDAVEEHCARFPQYCELIRRYDTDWEQSLGGPIWETVQILQALREAGYPLYALSNWSAEKFDLIRPRYDFLDWFEAIILSGSVGMVKPDPRIFNLTFEQIGHPAGECLVIDDSEANIRVAQDLGCRAIHFRSPLQLKAELEYLGIETGS
jgi:2-haloacid dehalogenase